MCLFCLPHRCWAGCELGVSMSEMARRLGLSVPAVSKSVRRGEGIAREGKFELVGNKLTS